MPALVAKLVAAMRAGDHDAGQRIRRELEAAGLRLSPHEVEEIEAFFAKVAA